MKKTIFLVLGLLALGLLLFTGATQAQQPVVANACNELFFSEYVEGSSYNKALEIFNGSASAIDLSPYQVTVSFNGGASEKSLNLSGTLAAGDVYVLAHGRADASILAAADVTNDFVINFNGDDAVILKKNGVIIDVIGKIGEDPGSYWGSGSVTTKDHTLRRKASVTHGDADGTDAFDPAVEWDGYPKNTFDGLGSHTANCGAGETPTVTPTATATPAPVVYIHDIQGEAHLSPYRGITVNNVPGIVTAMTSTGYWIQTADADVDASDATSEGIYVYVGDAPTVAVGDAVQVTGMVTEYYPGGTERGGLSITEIQQHAVTVIAHNQPLPAPVVIGQGGRTPPTTIIEDDATGSVNDSGVFDPDQDGIDFYESLEGMLVQVNNPLAVGLTNRYGEIPVVPDGGATGGVYSARRALVVRPDDFNPERIILDDRLVRDEPQVSVGDRFDGSVVGVLDYSYGNFKLYNTQPLPTVIPANLTEESAQPVGAGHLTVATMNVENLDPSDEDAKFAGLASDIVNRLHSPDIIALQEVQDNSGPEDDGVVAADQTYGKLIAAIKAAGGPDYAFTDISPENNQDGGQPGGNIRVGILYRPDRVNFLYRAGGDATTAVSVISGSNGPELSVNPGRIDPTNPAWEQSRKPLAAEFQFNGSTVFVIVNHFNSKYGDDALFGRYQPPRHPSETQRRQQAQVVQAFVAQILAIDSYADIIVLGDLNDFWFSNAVRDLQKDGVLTNLIERLPENERYTYIYQGNGQTLDHILISNNLADRNPTVDIVHANAEFLALPQRATDHDPVLATFYYGPPLRHQVWLPRVLHWKN